MSASLSIIHTEASLGWGGQEIRVLSEMAGMMARGHQLLLLCPAEARIHTEAQQRGVPVHALPIGRKRWQGLAALRQELRAIRPDVVVTHSSTDSWLTALATRWWRQAPPLVRLRHISAPVGRHATTRWLYGRAAAHVVTTGERLRSELIRDLRLPEDHVTSIPTGIALDRYAAINKAAARAELGLPADGLLIGIVATLRSWKGHRYLLDAWTKLPHTADDRLLVVGDGPGRDNLKRQAADLGIAERVVMPGNQANVAPWLAALDIFALPSYANEGVPQAIMQAMASGLPVISTPVGSIDEIVENELTGLLVPPRDTEALGAALGLLADDPALRRRLGEAGAARAQQRFGEALMLDRMETVFRGVIDRGQR